MTKRQLLCDFDVAASQCSYHDRIRSDGLTIEYEGHDLPRSSEYNAKNEDQPRQFPSGRLTQNGPFAKAVEKYRKEANPPELVKVYEKILPGVWSLKGFFDLIDYDFVPDGNRNVYRFVLKLSGRQLPTPDQVHNNLDHTRLIPSEVKKEVWKSDGGKCVICGDTKNLHFDHDLPFVKGGSSLTAKNVRLLCVKHNLAKSAKIE